MELDIVYSAINIIVEDLVLCFHLLQGLKNIDLKIKEMYKKIK